MIGTFRFVFVSQLSVGLLLVKLVSLSIVCLFPEEQTFYHAQKSQINEAAVLNHLVHEQKFQYFMRIV